LVKQDRSADEALVVLMNFYIREAPKSQFAGSGYFLFF